MIIVVLALLLLLSMFIIHFVDDKNDSTIVALLLLLPVFLICFVHDINSTTKAFQLLHIFIVINLFWIIMMAPQRLCCCHLSLSLALSLMTIMALQGTAIAASCPRFHFVLKNINGIA